VSFVGPATSQRPDPTPFPWEHLDGDDPAVLVSLGTVNAEAGERFFRAAIEALAERPVRGVVVAPPGAVGPVPPNVVAQRRVPQLALLPHMAAVVTHGGHNTVCEALAHGLPLVVAPIRDDQPVVAAQVVAAGAGVRVRFGRPSPSVLGEAIDRALHDPGLRAGAEVIATSFALAGGAPAAAAELEALAAGVDGPGPDHLLDLRPDPDADRLPSAATSTSSP
jgi:MGT family glycosyltransferase